MFCLFVYMANAVKKIITRHIDTKKEERFQLPERMVQIKISLDAFPGFRMLEKFFLKAEISGSDPVSQTRIQWRTPKLSDHCQQWDSNA